MPGALAIDGLLSGLNTSEIIDKIMAIERRSVTLLEARQARANTQLEAIRTLNTKLLAFQTSARELSSTMTFRAKAVSVSDETILTATAGTAATPGTYALCVNALARAHQIASQGFADMDSTVLGTGELQIQVGDGETVSLTVDSSNNTLGGLAEAINRSGAGVRATIINDGSDAAPYRLILSASESGADNVISITSTLSGGTGVEFNATSISDVVADAGNAYAGTATSSGTYTGTGNESYLIEIVDGGDLATATYRISEDGGSTWGSTQAFGGLGTVEVYDDVQGTDLGVDATFTGGTFGAGDRFVIDAFVPTVQEAADAELAIGFGAGQLTIRSPSNTVTDALPGLTLNLARAAPGQLVEIAVTHDTAGVEEKIQSFVDTYNEVVDYIREQTRFDPDSETAGVLLGSSAVLKVQTDLYQAVLDTVPGLPAGSNGLYAVGVSVTRDGKLELDTDDLAEALASDFDAVARLFQASGDSTHPRIRFVAVTSDTQPTTDGYEVTVTQAATRATFTGTSITDPAGSGLTIDETNDQLVLTINGTSTDVLTLAHKTYASGSELANEIAAKVAGSETAVAAVDVRFVDEGATGHFEIRTVRYGSATSVELGADPGNSAFSILGLSGGTSTPGQDVAGTIDGYEAEGGGCLLRATNEDSPAQGLQLEVTLTPEELGGGVSATVTVTKGVARRARDVLDYLVDPVDGYLKRREDRYQDRIDRYQDQIDRREELLARRRERLVAQFARLEQALAELQTQGSYLSAQMAGLTAMME